MIIGKSLTALGGGGLKPEICVTAKAGSLLNLHYKDSSIILKSYQLGAEETQHTFEVSVSETAYLVEDATNGKSVEVLVDTVAQYNVKIKYRLYIIESGIEQTDLTGGIIVGEGIDGNQCTIVRNSTDFYVYRTGSGRWRGEANSANKIDPTNREKLYLDFEYSATNTSNAWLSIWGAGVSIGVFYMGEVNYPQNTRQIVSVNLTESSGVWGFSMTSFAWGTWPGSFRIYNMWIE